MKKLHDKTERQKLILKVIQQSKVATQNELRDKLKEHTVDCDQATISRDIKELGLIRVTDEAGEYHYALLEEASPTMRTGKAEILRQFLRGVDWSGNLLVIHTDTANAHPVAEAIDHLGFSEIIGTVAGDNTILAVVKEGVSAENIARKLLQEAGKLK